MTRDEFSKPYLVALYHKNREQLNIALSVNELIKEFDLPRDKYLEKEVLEHLNFLSLTRSPPGSSGADEPIMITPHGKATAETWIEQGVGASRRSDSTVTRPLVGNRNSAGFGSGAFGVGPFAGPSYAAIDDAFQEHASTSPNVTASIDSSKWTGPRFVLTDAAVIGRIRHLSEELREKVNSIRIESNSDSQDLKGLADALVAVIGMAEPELSIIDRILSHPKFQISVKLIAAVATIRGALGI